ncbi:MAG: amidohydrolase family protein [Hyphomonas sp.]|nr:amidohydrolase family protein [Hyphomonas sp.]
MKKWIGRILLGVVTVMMIGAVSSYLFIDRELTRMYGGLTAPADAAVADAGAGEYALVNVNMLAPEGDRFLPDRIVVIENGQIRSIGNSATGPVGMPIIDGRGMYLVPGFTDSHIHLWESENDLLLYVANGVTQVRDMNTLPVNLRWKDEIEGGRIGPDIFAVAPQFATFGPMEGAFFGWVQHKTIVRTAAQVDAAVEDYVADGYDALKASSYLDRDGYIALSAAAAAHDIPLVGHLPMAIGLEDLWASNQSEVAHVEEFVKALDREFGGYGADTAEDFLEFVRERSEDVAIRMIAHDIAVTSTLELIDSFQRQKTDLQAELDAADLAYENPGISEGTVITSRGIGWLPGVNIYRWPEGWDADRQARSLIYWKAYAEAHHILLDAFLEAGVPIMAGTDANVPVRVPGFSLHEELVALQATGMSPAQILASATSVPGEFMGMSTGSIRPGQKASLVLLRDSPLEDIGATDAIEMVVIGGRVLDRQDLDRMLDAVKAANDASRTMPIGAP